MNPYRHPQHTSGNPVKDFIPNGLTFLRPWLLAAGLAFSVLAQNGVIAAEATPCQSPAADFSPLVKAALANDEDAALGYIGAGGDLRECVTEREVMQLAEPRKRITYVGQPTSGYPLSALLAVADMPRALAAIAQRDPAQLHAKDPHGNTALAWAARLFRADVVKVLLGQGLDPLQANDEEQTPLKLILLSREKSAQKTETVRALIAAVPRQRFSTIGVIDQVWVAAYMEDFSALRVLLEAGVPPHYVAIQGRTALMSAVEASNLEAVRLLLEHGARVSSYPYRGKTIFQIAESKARYNNEDATEINRLMQIEQEKLVRLGHNPPGTAPSDWNSLEGMERMRLLR